MNGVITSWDIGDQQAFKILAEWYSTVKAGQPFAFIGMLIHNNVR